MSSPRVVSMAFPKASALCSTLKLLLVACLCTLSNAQTFTHSAVFDSNMRLDWSVSGTTFTGRVTLQRTAWCAIGFSPDNFMPDTTAVLYRADLSTVTQNTISARSAAAIVEAPSTLSSSSWSQSGGVTTFDFTRELDVAGVRSIPATGNGIILWAYGSSNTFARHSNRGAMTVDFSPSATTESASPTPTISVTPSITPTISVTPTPTPSPVLGSSVVFDSNMRLDYDITGTTFTGRVTLNQLAWCAIGFSPDNFMPDTTAVLYRPDLNTVTQNTISARSAAAIVEVPGTLSSSSWSQSGGVTMFEFTRELDVAGVRSIPSTGNGIILYAYGASNTFARHSTRGAMTVDFTPAGVSPSPSPTVSVTPTPAPASPFAETVVFDSNMRLDYELSGNVLSGRVTLQRNSWCAIGFSGDTLMPGTTAILYRPDLNTVTQNLITARSAAAFTEVPGTLLSSSWEQSGGVTTFDFSRNLDVAGVRSIPATGESTILYAYGSDNTFSQHPGTARAALNVDFSTGSTSAVDRRTVEVIHGALMFIGWGILLPGGVFGARFLKDAAGTSATWFHVHRAVQSIGLLFVIGAFIIALDMVGGDHFDNPHKKWGLAVVCLGVIQPINAVLRPHAPAAGEEPTMVRRVWEILHKAVGYGAIIFGHVAIHYGLDEIEPKASDTVFALHHAWWILTLVAWIALSVWRRMRPAPSQTPAAAPKETEMTGRSGDPTSVL